MISLSQILFIIVFYIIVLVLPLREMKKILDEVKSFKKVEKEWIKCTGIAVQSVDEYKLYNLDVYSNKIYYKYQIDDKEIARAAINYRLNNSNNNYLVEDLWVNPENHYEFYIDIESIKRFKKIKMVQAIIGIVFILSFSAVSLKIFI